MFTKIEHFDCKELFDRIFSCSQINLRYSRYLVHPNHKAVTIFFSGEGVCQKKNCENSLILSFSNTFSSSSAV